MNRAGWTCEGLLVVVAVGLEVRVLHLRVLVAFHVVNEGIQ